MFGAPKVGRSLFMDKQLPGKRKGLRRRYRFNQVRSEADAPIVYVNEDDRKADRRPGVPFVTPSGNLRFRNERAVMYSNNVDTFMPVNPVPITDEIPQDIRPIVDSPNAEGLMFVGDSFIDKIKAIASDPRVKDLTQTAKTVYSAVRGKTKSPAPAASFTQETAPVQVAPVKRGMSMTTMLLIAGGGVAALGLMAILLKRRK